MKLNGLILAGGASIRMGSDKSVIEFHGVPQRQFLFELLKKFCDEVYTSCKPDSDIPAGFNPLPDKFDIRGPFNGILSAFSHREDVAWLTVPVDMPYIDENAVKHLLANRRDDKIATCYFDSDGKLPEPLFTVWEPSASAYLKTFFEAGKTRPREFLMTHDVHVIKSPTPLIHVNVNSPEDLERFRSRDRGSDPGLNHR
jgi:molybdenum cofactor guanylyltransferase